MQCVKEDVQGLIGHTGNLALVKSFSENPSWRMTAEDLARLRHLWAAGVYSRLADAAGDFDLSITGVRNLVKDIEKGAPLEPDSLSPMVRSSKGGRPTRFSLQDQAAIRFLHAGGMSIRQMAQQFLTDRNAIRRVLRGTLKTLPKDQFPSGK